MHNRKVSYFEECLRLGEWLGQDDRRALYKYLVVENKEIYRKQANSLLRNSQLQRTIASGEILFTYKNRKVSYVARKINTDNFTPEMREIKLSGIKFRDIAKLRKFFAQSDVDVIQNYPISVEKDFSESGFGIDAYPYYELSYYSNGKSRVIGLINKVRTNDRELLSKLRTL